MSEPVDPDQIPNDNDEILQPDLDESLNPYVKPDDVPPKVEPDGTSS